MFGTKKSTYKKENTEKVTALFSTNCGDFKIELFVKQCPETCWNFINLATGEQKTKRDGPFYNGLIFHRVIEGFMAQTGDVKYGNSQSSEFNLSLAGTGGSDLPNVNAEFSNIAHERGTISAARSSDPNSFNSQFFICFESAPHLDRQYTAFGKVTKGMEFIDMIKKGDGPNGSVDDPDKIISIK